MKCYVCKTGNLTISGTHEYCDNCNFSRFVVTEGYIDACIVVLAEIVSNTKFNTMQDAAGFIGGAIDGHLPMLSQFVHTASQGQQELIKVIVNGVVDQAVNLQIGEEIKNEQVAEKQLECSCGSPDFVPGSKYPKTLKCANDHCNAEFVYNEDTGLYEPYFLCSCGNMKYYQEEGTSLATCSECYNLYIHDDVHAIFRRVVRE